MRRLWFASWVLLMGLAACTAKFPTTPVNSSSPATDSLSLYVFWPKSDTAYATLQFTTQVKVYGKEVEGILLLKKKSALLYRATFLANGAYKLFDMELLPDTFRIVEHAKQLSNPVALRTLAHDMQLLTHGLHQTMHVQQVKTKDANWQMEEGRKTKLYFHLQHNQLQEVLETDLNDKKNIQLTMADYQDGKPQNLILQHLRFRMKIELRFLGN